MANTSNTTDHPLKAWKSTTIAVMKGVTSALQTDIVHYYMHTSTNTIAMFMRHMVFPRKALIVSTQKHYIDMHETHGIDVQESPLGPATLLEGTLTSSAPTINKQ